jgi:hypothetical protein
MNPKKFSIFSLIKNKLDAFFFAGNKKWFFIREFMLNEAFYFIVKSLKFREGEHQIGRLINIREVFKNMHENNLIGDIIEFGSHQGYGLYWLAYFRDKYGFKNVKVIGLDSFEGLPASSTIWKKGQFNDTSLYICRSNLKKYLNIQKLENRNIFLIKGWFDNKEVKKILSELSWNFSLVHIDCDLGSSSSMALELMNNLNTSQHFFILFDDWFLIDDEIPKSFNKFFKNNKNKFIIENISRTVFTNYFKVSVKK